VCPLRDHKLKSRRDSDGALVTSVGLEESVRSHGGNRRDWKYDDRMQHHKRRTPSAVLAEVEIAAAVRVGQPIQIIASDGVCSLQRPTCFVSHHTIAPTHAMKRRD
jgi:hypothetical protein